MKKAANITIKTIIDYENQECEQINENHQGFYYTQENFHYLEYEESAPDSGQLIMTEIKWSYQEPLEIIVVRSGAVNAKNILKKETADISQFETQIGELTIHTETDSVEISKSQCGGVLEAHYNLKINAEQVGDYRLTINYEFCD